MLETATQLSPIQVILDELYLRLKDNHEGQVATYIPELGKADPNWFAICLVTADGAIYEAGDTTQTFTIQSISKPFCYGMALEDNGKEEVLKKIWMEPSGEAFNSISLQPATGRPLNPMINAGAIASTGLVHGKTTAQKIHRIIDALSRYAGRPLAIDETVYRSESATGHRNRAIGHMLRNFDILTEEPTPALEAYFKQCSVLVHCRDLAIMAATLGNSGVNPITGQRAVVRDYVESILSVMSTCGMYDAAGEWIYQVGIPAKSGVAGGIMAVLPGQLGIGVFSPRLDTHGNSVRGIEVCRALSQKFNLHQFRSSQPALSVIRAINSSQQTGSKRTRSLAEQTVLQHSGNRGRHLHIQGELQFATAERVVRETLREAKDADHLLLVFKHTTQIDTVAAHLIAMLAVTLVASGKTLTLAAGPALRRLEKAFTARLSEAEWRNVEFVPDYELALEKVEARLLGEGANGHGERRLWRLEECELFSGLGADALQIVRGLLRPHRFAAGDNIIEAGRSDRIIYFLLRGTVDVWIAPPDRPRLRVASFSEGMALGEMALLDASPRSATVVAHTDVDCASLSADEFNRLECEHPAIGMAIMRNLAQVLSRRLRHANIEISAAHAG
jgi:glutaminase